MKGHSKTRSHLIKKTALTINDIQQHKPNRFFYLSDKWHQISHYCSDSLIHVYDTLQATFVSPHINYENFKKNVWPVISSGAAWLVGNYVTTLLSNSITETDEYDYVFKLLIGTAVLGYSISQRVNDKQIKSCAKLNAAITGEVVSIAYLYEASFRISRLLLTPYLSNEYALIASLGISVLGIPGLTSFVAKKCQQKMIKNLHAKGAQRSDTAAISSGMTGFANMYFQIGDALIREMKHPSRLFQAGLIAFNILDELNPLAQAKNAPALAADVMFPIYEAIREQQERIRKDFELNMMQHTVLRFKQEKAVFLKISRANLRTGDLVYCDENLDCRSVPISGDLIALQTERNGLFKNELIVANYSINLKAKNGEDISYLRKTSMLNNDSKQLDLHAIRLGQQNGVLTASRLDLFGKNNFFIRIKPEKERIFTDGRKKPAIITDYIMQAKNKTVNYAIAASCLFALLCNRNLLATPTWMFRLFQMMIPFSESFTRNKINEYLIKEINRNLPKNQELPINDALYIVDFCNAIGGLYQDRFPKGVAIISDKTGTLTTSGMEVLGCWHDNMPTQVQNLDEKQISFSERDKDAQQLLYEIFVCAYTNNKKEIEPEEDAIRIFLARNEAEFKVEALGSAHLKKIFFNGAEQKTIETFHLGLYLKFGGRFTLATDNDRYYLVFCGIPKSEPFSASPVLTYYKKMQPRLGVLSRDWCVARTEISNHEFAELRQLFFAENFPKIEIYLNAHLDLLNKMICHGIFIINNPIKKGAEKFITQCRSINVPVFVATGDSAKAAENIARVLCPLEAKHILTVRDNNAAQFSLPVDGEEKFTLIFAGLNDKFLALFDILLSLPAHKRPVILFAEMSTQDKGTLALHLKAKRFFLAVNGDGTNDIAMMYHANTVFAHLADDGNYAPGIEQFANLNDRQLQYLHNSNKSFYELFDLHQPTSLFIQHFARLANSQVKPLMGLSLKTSKIGWELFKELGASNVREMSFKHPKSVAFDLIWVGETIEATLATADLPADNRNLAESDYLQKAMLASLGFAVLQAALTYAFTGKSVNESSSLTILFFFPIVLRCIYHGFGATYRQLNYATNQKIRSDNNINFFQNKAIPRVESKSMLLENYVRRRN